jgi:hypothetical protein
MAEIETKGWSEIAVPAAFLVYCEHHCYHPYPNPMKGRASAKALKMGKVEISAFQCAK